MALGSLVEAIDSLVEAEAEQLGDGDTVAELFRQLSRLEAVASAAAARFHEEAGWAASGSRSAAMWLAVRTHLPKGECHRRVRLGRQAAHLPRAARAWAAGDIGASHMNTLAGLRRPETEQALVRDEEMLVDHARHLRFDQFSKVAAYWDQRADPDGADDKGRGRHDRRDVYLAPSLDGMYLGRMTLDPLSGEIVARELDRLENAMFEADRAEARRRLGRDPIPADLARSPHQRRADALVEMATRSATCPKGGRRPAPLVRVLCGDPRLDHLLELASGIVVTPAEVAPWLARAEAERIRFRAKARVEVSERARLFTGATRRAIEVRDRECTHPFCDQPAHRCQVDHIVPYEADGPTTQDNGRLLCPFHNRLRHKKPDPPPGN